MHHAEETFLRWSPQEPGPSPEPQPQPQTEPEPQPQPEPGPIFVHNQSQV